MMKLLKLRNRLAQLVRLYRQQQPQNQREGATRFGRRHHARNRNKAGDFRRWLVDTFGFDTLSSGEGILDVAGGKGELAFELRNISGIPVTVVDPRPMRLDRYVRRFRSGIYHRNQSQVASKLRRPQTSSLQAPTHRQTLPDGVQQRERAGVLQPVKPTRLGWMPRSNGPWAQPWGQTHRPLAPLEGQTRRRA